jgi:hypothetical protein
VIPPHFALQPIQKTEARLKLLVRLIKRKDVDGLVNACDAGREGELIFNYIVQHAKTSKPVERLWLQSMTQQAIRDGPWREKIDYATEVAPIAYMRGRTFDDAVCIFDEAQNASTLQLKLFLTRFGENSKIIITGDPSQSDLAGKVALVDVMQKLRGTDGIGVVEFKSNSIVRHPLVGKIIDKLGS